MKPLTVAYITSRPEPKIEWFLDSLELQLGQERVKTIIVDSHAKGLDREGDNIITPPKPTVWQGECRIPKDDWWAASNARNTAFCLCETEWIAFVDDRCVLQPGWLASVQAAMDGGYAVCGSYEKRTGLTVELGIIRHAGIVTGKDCRNAGQRSAQPCPGQWLFGCTFALPLEWALEINGFEELCDGLSMEDVIFGLNLVNAGKPLRYDPRMMIVEDRTPGQTGKVMRRTSKERFSHDAEDKGHKALARFGTGKRTQHHWDLREIRNTVLAGGEFPKATQPTHDWFDGMDLREFDKLP